jgi:hypothetical protein
MPVHTASIKKKLHIMNRKRFYLPLLLCCFVINSNAQTKPQTLTGRWVGTYGNNEKSAPYYFSFAFTADSTVITYTAYNKVYGHGKYKLLKNKLTLTYRVDNDVQQYECTGVYNDSTKALAGNWRRISDVGTKYKYTQKGKWVMKIE